MSSFYRVPLLFAVSSFLLLLWMQNLDGSGKSDLNRIDPLNNFYGVQLSESARIYSQQSVEYAANNYQYASSTMKNNKWEAQNFPGLIFYPANIADVASVVKWARASRKSIAIRTGGHSYNGASTTNSSNILLDLSEAFPEKEYNAEKNEARIGVSTNLLDFHSWLEKQDMFLPHGYGGNVFLGGHSQTGGMATLVRSFGLLIDHIVRVEIVDADGSVRIITKETDNGDYFFALLGSNNGNFGVVTHVVFKPLHNKNYPKSKAIRLVVPYSKERLHKYMDFAMRMANNLSTPGDFELCVTMFSGDVLLQAHALDRKYDLWSGDRIPVPADAIVIFAGWMNLGGPQQSETEAIKWFEQLVDIAGGWKFVQGLVPIVDKLLFGLFASGIGINFEQHTPVSVFEGSWTFNRNREYRLLYEKKVQYIPREEPADWATWSVERIDQLVRSGLSKTLVQALVIGGDESALYKNREGGTAFSFRNTTVCIGLDAFFDSNIPEQQQFARTWQDTNFAEGVTQKRFVSADLRSLSFPFSDDFDLNAVSAHYFDSDAVFRRLQRIKKRVDPFGVFSANKFRVLPDESTP